MSKIIIVFMNASAGKSGIDGGTRFLLEVIRFWKMRDAAVYAVGTVPHYSYLCKNGLDLLAQVPLIKTPSYDLEREVVGPGEMGVSFVRRALETKRIVADFVAGQITRDSALTLDVFFQDHLPETVPAFHVKKLFGAKINLYFGRHLLVYSLFRGFTPFHIKSSLQWPSSRLVYHFITQSYATRLARRCDVVFSVANASDRDFLVGRGFAGEKIVVTPYAPETELIERVAAGARNDRASYLGRYHQQKGLEELIPIVRTLKTKWNRNLVVDLMGNLDPLRPKIPTELSANFVFHGSVYNEEKYRKLKASKFLIFPSHHESFGLVILEAMSCGIPVVAYDLPVYRENIEKGIVRVPIGDTERFAEEVARLYDDGAYYSRLVGEALAEAKRFDWNVTMSKLFDGNS